MGCCFSAGRRRCCPTCSCSPGNAQRYLAPLCRPRKVVSVDAMDATADWPTRVEELRFDPLDPSDPTWHRCDAAVCGLNPNPSCSHLPGSSNPRLVLPVCILVCICTPWSLLSEAACHS
eukprot:GHRQ01026876.1.p2 GENE.GHRQ01026876.1~~GHRQ01026876.1.p2  ORF type:complete len:119 (-),score=2.39 GHRQ01026876.1:438-794(-)